MFKITGIIFILAIYLISGFNKIFDYNKTVLKIKDKFLFNRLPLIVSKLAILTVILVWTIGSILLIYSVLKNNKIIGIISTSLLACLTTIITFYFHSPFDETQTIHFLKNLSIVGSFIFLLGYFLEK